MGRGLLASSLLLVGFGLGATEIPITPISTLSRAVDSRETIASKERTTSNLLWVTPGVNQIVPVAIGHLNRLVTPFDNPQVTTSSAVTTEIRQNVIYVGTDNESAVTLFITEKGEENAALSITILPQRIPPCEISLRLAGQVKAQLPTGNKRARSWEQAQPYVSTIRALMRQLALGEIPQGYVLSPDFNLTLVTCKQPGLQFDFTKGQQLVGHHLAVRVGLAKNISTQPIEFNEYSCANWKVAAVAAWPKNVLKAGESTEIFVVQKLARPGDAQTTRPSLLGNN